MKSERGVTLVSLIIYIIGMLIAVTIVTVLNGYFYKNVDLSKDNLTPLQQFTKFNSYFTEEINNDETKVLETYTNEDQTKSHIIFKIGQEKIIQYTFTEGKIYLDNIKIGEGIEKCIFNVTKDEEKDKTLVNVYFKINENNFERNINYALKN